MQLVEERHEGLGRDRPGGAPGAPAHLLARDRIDEDLVVIQLVGLPGRGIDARQHAHRQRVTRLDEQWEERHAAARIALLDPTHQLGGRQRLADARRSYQVRIEDPVELAIPGDHRAGQAGHEQEGRDGEAQPPVRQGERETHRGRLEVEG